MTQNAMTEGWGDAQPLDVHENGVVQWFSEASTAAEAPPQPKLQGSAIAGVFAGVEIVWFLGETFMVMVLAIAVRSLLLFGVSIMLSHELLHAKSTVFDVLFDASFLLVWLLQRYSYYFHLKPLELCRIWGIVSWRRLEVSTSLLILYHVVGFCGIIVWQWYEDNWFLSLDNYMDEDDELQVPRILEILFLSPLKEEFIFRGIIFHIFLNRIPSNRSASLVSSILFGCTHLINLKNSNFSIMYVLLQTCLGIEIGFYYSILFFQSKFNLLNSLVLHIVNNIFSSFVSTHTAALDFLARPIFTLMLAHAIVLYIVLISLAIRSKKKPKVE
ncbi:hypothetical protein THRCLA_20969 [Thraustotheca clavata]|uniref:CAAX prenyl protease 2/Lysostaphin resistance protein A-like domain-containing protein n=1 Tax=Thraustotheca clavata TaxID=74557 RepID=A0A1W0A1R3_9STRA|nr:hypothetical protein THRCLA_20969 [Thraustotheca clavata]